MMLLARGGFVFVWGFIVAAGDGAWAQDVVAGKAQFAQSCAVCHSDSNGPSHVVVNKQGPSLVGVVGRRAGTVVDFNYSKALTDSRRTWDAAALDKYLENPMAAVPGTTMPMAVADRKVRQEIIAYLATLKADPGESAATQTVATTTANEDIGDWRHAAPGVKYHIRAEQLPAPFSSSSAGNGPRVVSRPEETTPLAPPGFRVKLFASGLSNPRLLRVAPNGDIFLAETGAGRVRILRAADGAETPSENQIFAEGLDRPFGLAFYPPGPNPQWLYVANNNEVVRLPYKSGDLKAQGEPQVIVPRLTDSQGGHSTRDIAFSADGKRLFVSVGSGSNVAEGMETKSPEEMRAWEAEHGKGAAWGSETNRAAILWTDPEGRSPLRSFATGIRNGVGIAVDPATGKLWVSTNERDGLGDDLVPDYVSSVKEGGYYGWPWYYLGDHEDPRLKGQRPDLAGQALVPDVLVQAHSASLQLCFYPEQAKGVAAFPAAYRGNIFAAEHGSWNRHTRTAYKVIRVRLNHGVATGEYEDFLTGFVVDDRSVWGRPVGVAVAHDGALLVSEDGNQTVWRVAPVR